MSLSWLDVADDEESDAAPKVNDVELAKKVYQEIEETVRYLNVTSSRCTKVEDLFASDILETRFKIQTLCEGLISNYSPSLYGFCSREKLWKHVYYDAVQRARKLQREKPWSPLQLAYIKAHIETGIARLHFFVMKIQEAAELDSKPLMKHPSSLDSILNTNSLVIQKSRTVTDDDVKDQKKLVELLAMCYINMGDLYRYMKDIYAKSSPYLGNEKSDMDYFHRAQEWYTQAFLMNPSAGLALNQLGNIYSDQSWGIDSVYYLLYSTLTENAYEGAFPNLRHMLDTRMVQFARRPALPEPRPIELLCNGFTGLLFQLLFEETPINYEKFCKEILTNFHERLMTYDPDLDDKLLFKFAAISVMVVWRLQTNNSVHTSPAVAFAMSVFFTLVTQLGVILEGHSTILKISESCHSRCEKDLDDVVTSHSNPKIHCKEETMPQIISHDKPEYEENAKLKEVKQKHRKQAGACRGPRFRSSSIPSLKSLESDQELDNNESDCEEDDEDEDDSDYLWSESEQSESGDEYDYQEDPADRSKRHTNTDNHPREDQNCANGMDFNVKAFLSSSSSNGRSEPSTSGSGNNSQKSIDGLQQELMDAFHQGKQTPFGDGESSSGEEERSCIEVKNLLKCQSQIEPLLIALTPFIRWLQTSPAVKDALAANAEKIFLIKLCEILTVLTSKNWAAEVVNDDDEGRGHSENDKKVNQELVNDWETLLTENDIEIGKETRSKENLFQFQLSEDRSMLGMPALKQFLRDLKIDDQLTSQEQLATRIGRFISFGMWMTKTESFSIMYAEESRKFFVPNPEMLKRHMRATRIKKLLTGKNEGPENMCRLTRAYQEMKLENRERRNRDRDGRGRRYRKQISGGAGNRDDGKACRRRGRASGVGGGRRRLRNTRRRVDEKPVYIVVDMESTLKYMEIIKRLTCHKNFFVYVPNSVFDGLDMMKDTDVEMSEVANDSYQWIDAAVKRGHQGIKILKKTEKLKLHTVYPDESKDIEMWEYIEMLECCHFVIKSFFEGNPYNYANTSFGDQRDKYSVFFLSGNDTLLDTTMKRGFDPIKIARSLPGVYVDCINNYPPSETRRVPSPHGRKWQTSGKCKG